MTSQGLLLLQISELPCKLEELLPSALPLHYPGPENFSGGNSAHWLGFPKQPILGVLTQMKGCLGNMNEQSGTDSAQNCNDTELKNDLGLSHKGIERKNKYLILHSMRGFKYHQDTSLN